MGPSRFPVIPRQAFGQEEEDFLKLDSDFRQQLGEALLEPLRNEVEIPD